LSSRHPDKNENCGNICKEKFYAINEAWKVLGNPKSRENYDSVTNLLILISIFSILFSFKQSHGMLEMIKSKAVSLTG